MEKRIGATLRLSDFMLKPITMKTRKSRMNYELWLRRYQPIKNPYDIHASYDGYAYETYGSEVEEIISLVRKEKGKFVWTLLDSDGSLTIAAGYHIVNRMSHFITEIPWGNETLEVKAD